MKHPSAEPGPASQVKGIAAIILAAGYSSRMGTPKPMLKIGNRTILERAIELFRDVGIEDVIVVVGHRANEIISDVEYCRARAITNEQFERGMFLVSPSRCQRAKACIGSLLCIAGRYPFVPFTDDSGSPTSLPGRKEQDCRPKLSGKKRTPIADKRELPKRNSLVFWRRWTSGFFQKAQSTF